MFLEFCKSEGPRCRPPTKTIEAKRQRILDAIDVWLEAQASGHISGRHRLSIVEDGRRYVWLLYGRQRVPLTANGDKVGEIDAAQNEAVFWQWMKQQIAEGAYDERILELT